MHFMSASIKRPDGFRPEHSRHMAIKQVEEYVTPTFIESTDYGTRASTILLADKSNYIQLWERSFSSPGSRKDGEVFFKIDIELPS
jgi:uncharacterized protein with NRDE domain